MGSDRSSYLVVGKEKGANGTPHLQGYVEFCNATRGSAMRKLFGGRGHWEVRKGSPKQASDYCLKEDIEAIVYGEISKQGKRSELEDVSIAVLSRTPTSEIAETFPGTFMKYHKGIKALQQALMTERKAKPTVMWVWGTSGTGKTRMAVDANESYYIKDSTQWWDGYEQQNTIIIDDFDRGKWPFRDLLRLLDRYPYQGQTKGGYCHINSPLIFITCEHAPAHYWTGNDLAQIERRLDKVTELTL